MLGIHSLMKSQPSKTWQVWIKHIMKQKENFKLAKAGLFKLNGNVVSTTQGFQMQPKEISILSKVFEKGLQDLPVDSLALDGATYVIRERDERQLIAFNGAKYFIVTKSKTFLLVVVCESRARSTDAALWLRKLTNRLIEKDF